MNPPTIGNMPFTKEQIDLLYNIMGKSEVSSSSCAFAQSGSHGKAYKICSISNSNPWILDSGASDHMGKESNSFVSYNTCFGKKVQVANGCSLPVKGKGNVLFSPKITLSSVLHVPNMTCNLLSVSKLTKANNCSVVFYPNHYVFRDLSLGRMIGSAKKKGGLYYLELEETKKLQAY